MKKGLLVLVLCAILSVMMFGCSVAVASAADEKPIRIAMCTQEPNLDFYVPTRIGALDAGAALGVEVLWLGPSDGDIATLLAIIETQIESGVSGLGIQAADPAALITVVELAKERNIPCIVFNNTREFEGYDGFVGIDPLYAGGIIGQQIEKILSGEHEWSAKLGIKPGTTPSGKIAFFTDQPGAYNLEARREGIANALSAYSGIEDVGLYDSTSEGVARAMEVVENVITANPDIKVLASVCAGATAASGMVVQQLGAEDKILVIGMDTLDQTLTLVKEGVIPMAIGQDPYSQGYYPVEQLVNYLRNGTPIPRVTSTEVEIITVKNVDEVIARESAYLEAGTKLSEVE